MTSNYRMQAVFGAVAIYLSLQIGGAHAETPLERIQGEWQVVEAHYDTLSARSRNYWWNDPRLVGRLFYFSSAEVRNDVYSSSRCMNPSFHRLNVRLDDVVHKSMGSPYGASPDHPTAASYEISSTDELSPSVIQIYCGRELWEGGQGTDEISGAWIAPLKNDRLVIRWYDETLLVLRKVPAHALPHPSFACAQAEKTAERTICSSYQLSAVDRSVSDAYQRLIRQMRRGGDGGISVKRVINTQVAWLRLRNSCGSNQECLLESMRERLEDLGSALQI